jgi:hypothetical protein
MFLQDAGVALHCSADSAAMFRRSGRTAVASLRGLP